MSSTIKLASLHGMESRYHSKGETASKRKTCMVERIVASAEESPTYIAYAVKTWDDIALMVKCLCVLVRKDAGTDA